MDPFTVKLKLSGCDKIVGTGWLPPVPDLRDYTGNHEDIKALTKKLGISKSKKTAALVDLRKWCSPVEDQGELGSCTANAVTGIIEYFENRAYNKHIDASRLFLYKTTRKLMKAKGDSGAWLRSTIGALVFCGVPAEKLWPYNITKFDEEPEAFLYSVADNYRAVKYFCHDPVGAKVPFTDVLASAKQYLEGGVPSVFGFWGFPSYDKSDASGCIPYPAEGESAEWGHAVMAVGYDDNKIIRNLVNNNSTKGALLFKNSWGKEWGEEGYGWLPYDYVINNLADDFWSIISMNWVDSNQFGI